MKLLVQLNCDLIRQLSHLIQNWHLFLVKIAIQLLLHLS